MAADERDDLEVEWARIVAGYDRDADPPVGGWPAQEDVADDGGVDSGVDSSQPPAPAAEITPVAPAPDRGDEHHFVPPTPPPLGRPDLPTGAAWSGLLGGPGLLMLATFLGWRLPSLIIGLCIVGFVGGLLFLVTRLDDGNRRDGWDNGAQV